MTAWTPRRPQAGRGLLPRAPAAEVLAGDDDIARLHLLGELGVEVLHGVLGHLGRLHELVRVPSRKNDVRVDVVPVFPNASFAHVYFLGSVILPSSAEAAAVAGEAR